MTPPHDGDGIAATLSDPNKFLQLLPGLISEPLGAVSVAQQLITLHRNSPDQLASLFHLGVPVLPPTDLVGALLPFLAPEPIESSARRAQRRQQAKILEGQVNWPDFGAAQGTAHIICSDSDSEIGLPKQLYFSAQDRELVSLSSFSQLISRLVSLTTGGVLADASGRRSGTEAALSNVLYELFKNTEDHATHELSGADIRGSVRGIYAQFFGAPVQVPKKVKDIVHTSPSRAYWEHTLETKRRPARQGAAAGVLEISVFDSGPGMAARWSGREVSSESAADQISSVLACFKKGQTSTAAPARDLVSGRY